MGHIGKSEVNFSVPVSLIYALRVSAPQTKRHPYHKLPRVAIRLTLLKVNLWLLDDCSGPLFTAGGLRAMGPALPGRLSSAPPSRPPLWRRHLGSAGPSILLLRLPPLPCLWFSSAALDQNLLGSWLKTHQLNLSIWNRTGEICIVKVPEIHWEEKAAFISLQGRVARGGRPSGQFDDDSFITGPLFSNGSCRHSLNKFILLLPDEHIQMKVIICVASCICLVDIPDRLSFFSYASALLTIIVGKRNMPGSWVGIIGGCV